MRVLVTAASKHGSTWEIAERIARVLSQSGHAVKLMQPKDVAGISGFEAVVIGSSVYVGSWLPEAIKFVNQHQEELNNRPVWLFSSGPIGHPPMPPEDKVVRIDEMLTKTKAKDHFIFGGKLEKEKLSFPEKLMVRALKIQFGDFRDWEDVEACAQSIVVSLSKLSANKQQKKVLHEV